MKRAKTVIIHFYLRIYPCVSFTADENMNEEMMNNMKEDEPRFSCSLFFRGWFWMIESRINEFVMKLIRRNIKYLQLK